MEGNKTRPWKEEMFKTFLAGTSWDNKNKYITQDEFLIPNGSNSNFKQKLAVLERRIDLL